METLLPTYEDGSTFTSILMEITDVTAPAPEDSLQTDTNTPIGTTQPKEVAPFAASPLRSVFEATLIQPLSCCTIESHWIELPLYSTSLLQDIPRGGTAGHSLGMYCSRLVL